MTTSLSGGSAEPTALGTVYQGDIMSDPTREEFDAKLTIAELRTENRFNELSSKIDRVVDFYNRFKLHHGKCTGWREKRTYDR